MMEFTLFLFFSIGALVTAFMVITSKNAVHSVLFLILVFCNVSCLLLVLGAEFFSFMFLIVYVGAIAFYFLFVVMMLNIKNNPLKIHNFFFNTYNYCHKLYFCKSIIHQFQKYFKSNSSSYSLYYISWLREHNSVTNIETLGLILYTKYSILFLMCGILLLLAMIGAIVLTMHQRSSVKKTTNKSTITKKPSRIYKVYKFT
uniref:NADH-ubiquinone oxidoreductase chain 6 n=1 Tax=Neogoniolithon spectabile TaxID=231755 RepID=A0A3G3MIJ4_9FLOR|nr:NADH dehydrogenase subunit 6 [Neogoniolithon spectabile]AYR06673.1 NADH dehydrogenase subunit 6 [Neogoniolithon spectabile]